MNNDVNNQIPQTNTSNPLVPPQPSNINSSTNNELIETTNPVENNNVVVQNNIQPNNNTYVNQPTVNYSQAYTQEPTNSGNKKGIVKFVISAINLYILLPYVYTIGFLAVLYGSSVGMYGKGTLRLGILALIGYAFFSVVIFFKTGWALAKNSMILKAILIILLGIYVLDFLDVI